MPLDPDLAGLLQLVQAGTPMAELTPVEARESFRKLTEIVKADADPVRVASVEPVRVPGAVGDLHARVYRPEVEGPCPTVVFFHGGGFVIGDLDTHDRMARTLCHRTESVVVSVGYRLAPEDPFPAAAEDAVASTRWIQSHLEEFGGDPRLAVAGDSAGGNLAAVATQQVPALTAQLLIYPATDGAQGEHGSRTENGEGYLLDRATLAWFMDHYRPRDEDVRFSPLRGSLAGLPPAVVATAEFDPLRDEGEAYAAALREAGVEVVLRRYDGMIHGFMDLGPAAPAAQTATDDAIDEFGRLLRAH